MSIPRDRLTRLAKEVKALHERDDELGKLRQKTAVEQRDLRLAIGEKVTGLDDVETRAVAQVAGLEPARLRNYAFVRAQWPDGTFPADAHFTSMEELARDPDRFTKLKSGMSKRDAREAKGGRVDTPSRWSPTVKADYVREALNDPEVARQVMRDQATRAAVAEAEWDARRERQATKDLTNPRDKRLRENTERLELLRSLDNVRFAIARAVAKAQDLKLGGDKDLIASANEIASATGWLQAYATGGATDFEDALARLLSEGN